MNTELTEIGDQHVDREQAELAVQDFAHPGLGLAPDLGQILLAVATLADDLQDLVAEVRFDGQQARLLDGETEI